MSDKDLRKVWEKKYKIYENIKDEYYAMFDKYFPIGFEKPSSLMDEKARKKMTKLADAKLKAAKDLDDIERKMFGIT